MSPVTKDNKAYEYARWADSTISVHSTHAKRPGDPDTGSARIGIRVTEPFVGPILGVFYVPSDYNFHSPVCKGVDFICWPTVGASSIEYYASKGTGILGWDKALLITTLKRSSLYVLPLTPDGQHAAGHMWRYFQSENRYRTMQQSIRTAEPFILRPTCRTSARRWRSGINNRLPVLFLAAKIWRHGEESRSGLQRTIMLSKASSTGSWTDCERSTSRRRDSCR